MKFLVRLLLLAVLAVIADRSLLAAKQLYTCGMHPQVIRDQPGDCPICGMKLQPVRDALVASSGGAPAAQAGAGERKIKYYKSTMLPGEVRQTPGKDSMGMDMVPVYEDEANTSPSIRIDAATIQRMNLKTALVERGPVRRAIETVGIISYDERTLRDITTKYDGWLERLYVNAPWTPVKAGDPLFEIYSPDLYNAELNYLVARKTEGASGGPLTRAATGRLKLFDVPDSFVQGLATTGEASRTFLFRAPSDGVVIEKMAVQGQMMKAGERIFRLADLSEVWAIAQIYEKDFGFVHVGEPVGVKTTYGVERSFSGTIDLIEPQVEEQTRTATARIVLKNPDYFLRPGMYVEVHLSSTLTDSAVLVPDIAVLRSGDTNTVFVVMTDGSFEPRQVELGERSEGNYYEVLSGLHSGERVVTSGQFMLDSESNLREAVQKMLRGDANPSGPQAHDESGRQIKYYKSTMMPGEVRQTPGKDSMGMDMVPVYESGNEAK